MLSTDGRSLDVRVYGGSARIESGSFVPSREESGLASWVTVEPPLLELAPHGSDVADVTIRVPADAEPGEYYGVIWAEPPAAQGEVQIVNRVGVRIYLSVGTGAEPAPDFEVRSLIARRNEENIPVVEATVVNTGGRAIDLSAALTLSEGPAGLTAGPLSTEGVTTLAPADSGPVFVELDPQLPAGPWLARMVVRSGALEKAVEARIVFPGAAGEAAEPVEATEVPLHQDRGFLVPLALGLLLLALVLVLLVWLLAKRRRDEDEEDGHADADEPKDATVVAE